MMSSESMWQAAWAILALAAFAMAQNEEKPAMDEAKAMEKGAAILDAMEAKIGGIEKRAAMSSLRMKGELQMSGMPKAGTIEELWLGKDKVRWNVGWPGGMGGATQGRNGDMCWSTDPAMGITILEGDEKMPVARYFDLCRHAPWRTMYESASLIATVDFEGKSCHQIAVTPKVGKSTHWYVDAETGLLHGAKVELPDMMGGWMSMVFLFEDWKDAGGVLWPQVKKQKIGAYLITYAFKSIEPDATIDAAAIEPPEDVRKAHANPKRKKSKVPEKPGEYAVEETTERHTAMIRAEIDASKISENLAVMFPEIFEYVTKSGGTMDGPPYSRYHKIDGGKIDLECGIPVKEPIASKGRVVAAKLPAGKAAVTWHFGPYGDLKKTYDLLEAWMKEQKLIGGGAFWEIYWTDPGIEPDQTKWRTQIVWPIE